MKTDESLVSEALGGTGLPFLSQILNYFLNSTAQNITLSLHYLWGNISTSCSASILNNFMNNYSIITKIIYKYGTFL